MQRSRRSLRSFVALFSMVAVLGAVSCDRSDGSWEGQVVIGIGLEARQRWAAEGDAVERGRLCPSGTRHVLEVVDPTTQKVVSVRVWSRIVEEAVLLETTTEIDFLVENTCADGSGSFVTSERWGPDVWSVESGTGAYRELFGAGELSFATADYMATTPLRLYLDGVLGG